MPLTSCVPNPVDEPGPNRLTRPYYESNYGLVDIDWDADTISLRIMNLDGQQVHGLDLRIEDLIPG